MIPTIITFLFFLILQLLTPNIGKGKLILNVKWKNIDEDIIMFIEPSFGTKSKLAYIENGKTLKGIAKFTEKGTQLHLSLPDKDLFYKVVLVEKKKLELVNMANNEHLYFEQLGSNTF